MSSSSSALELAQELIRLPTVNPPGDERAVAELLAARLQRAGVDVETVAFGPRRANLLARIGTGRRQPLCLSGHLDTVAIGDEPWSFDPFGAEIDAGLLYGRGSSDMKGGVAAIIVAAERLAALPSTERPDVTLVLTAGEETACAGAASLRDTGRVPKAAALIVAEPTANRPCLGHRGLLWLRATTQGRAAHAATPDDGVNAIEPMSRAVCRLAEHGLGHDAHEILGGASLNIATINGGSGINSVPDRCELGIDIRTLPGQTAAQLEARIGRALGPEVALSTVVELPAVFSASDDPFVREVAEIALGDPDAIGDATVPFCTDASILQPVMGALPAVVCGPGEPSQAHRTDEYCPVAQIEAAAETFFEIGRRWGLA